jgi:hypothetical protein
MIRKMLPIAAAAAMIVACGDSTEPRVPTSLQVDQSTLSLQVGETKTVEAFIVDQHGRAYDAPPEGFAITWATADGGVAIVQAGQVTGVGSGQTTITATAGSLPAVQIPVQVEGALDITGGTFDLPLLRGEDPDDAVVTAQIGFSYSGHRTGTFSVNNTFALGEISLNDSFAYTFFNAEFGDQDFVAWQRRDDGLIDYMEFYVQGAVTQAGTSQVYLGFLFIGYDVGADTAEAFYILDAEPGTITFTTATDTRLAGTFTLSMDAEALGLPLAADTPAMTRDGLRELRPRVPRR